MIFFSIVCCPGISLYDDVDIRRNTSTSELPDLNNPNATEQWPSEAVYRFYPPPPQFSPRTHHLAYWLLVGAIKCWLQQTKSVIRTFRLNVQYVSINGTQIVSLLCSSNNNNYSESGLQECAFRVSIWVASSS